MKSFFISFFIFSGTLIAQTGFIPLSLDHAFFRGAENQVYLEIYLSFYENFLTYIPQENQLIAEYVASADIIRDDSTLHRKLDRRISQIDTQQTSVTYRKFLNVFGFYLQPGEYTAKAVVQDLHSSRIGEYIFDFICQPISEDSLTLSDIQLCAKLLPDTSKNEFHKNAYLTIPNPEGVYSITSPILYYYTELYNLTFDPGQPGDYLQKSYITDLDGQVIKEFREKKIKKPGESSVIVGGYNIVTLPNSSFFLNVEVTDLQSLQVIQKSKRFSFVKPTPRKVVMPDSATFTAMENQDIAQYLSYSEKDLDQEFQKVQYISSSEQKSIFKNLDLAGKRVFLAKFWRRLDTNPQTEINEYKQQYMELVNYANVNFGAMNKEGWQTDRGRVLLTYGRPNEIERNYMLMDMKPHEIWHYHELEGGVIFVFADLSGFGDFDLLHSTYSREFYQPEWQRLVLKTQTSSDFDMRY